MTMSVTYPTNPETGWLVKPQLQPTTARKRPPYLLTVGRPFLDPIRPKKIWPPEDGYILYHAQVEGGMLWLVWQDVGA